MLALVLLLGLTIGVGFLMLLSSRAKRSLPFSHDSRTTHYRHSGLLRLFAVLVFFGAELALGVWLILYPPRTTPLLYFSMAVAIVLGVLGLLLIWESYRFGLLVSPTALECRSPWKSPRTMAWSSVTRLTFSRLNSWFILQFADGSSFRISTLVPGITHYLTLCEQHLSVEQLAPARRGFAAVGHPWRHAETPAAPIHWRRWVLAAVSLMLLTPVVLFVVNGVWLASGETPIVGQFVGVTPTVPVSATGELRVVAYNIAKAFAQRSGLQFNSRESVETRLAKMAEVIRNQKPDVVVLSEVMTECGPANVNQLEFLAKACGLPYYAFGENYNFGLPFYRVVGGNAILARKPLKADANIPLSGRRPFYVTRNNRRALFATMDFARQPLLIGSLHNDSYDIRNNAVQVQQIVDHIGPRSCVLAGDFNATPESEPIALLKQSARFVGEFEGDATFPEKSIRIDYVFGPATWKHISTKVIPSDASDHHAVLSVFRLEK